MSEIPRNAEGRIDLAAWRRQDLATGRRCRTCEAHIVFGSKGVPADCFDCQQLRDYDGDVEHSRRLRCPACRHGFDFDVDDHYKLYEEGEHYVCCPSCDADFTVETRVEFHFTSPAIVGAVP